MTERLDDLDGNFLGYRIEEPLGRGGMGVVYRAYDVRLKRTVALKLIAPEFAADLRFRERFERESELAMSLEHPNVIPIHDAGEAYSRLYLAMRCVEGADLRALLHRAGALEPRRALEIVRQVGNALDAAHARGLVHRDVKPSNVLLDSSEHAYLADFGLTRRFAENGSSLDARSLGTPAYLAPEQIEGRAIDGRADVYSLGCLLYECLTGAPPFAGSSRLAVAWAHLEQEPPRATERRPELPASLDPVIAKAMAKEPEDRYETCGDFADAARTALGLPRRWSRRRRALLVAAVAAVIAVAVGLFAMRAGGTSESKEITHNTLVRVDPRTNRVVGVVEVGKFPGAAAAAGDRVWTYNFADSSVSEVDAASNDVRHTTKLVTKPYVVTGAGSVVAADADGAWVAGFIPTTGRSVLTRIRRGGETDQYSLGANVVEVAMGNGVLWVLGRRPSGTQVIRVDPRTGHVTRRLSLGGLSGGAGGLTFGGGLLWLVDEQMGVLYRVDPATGDVDSVDLGGLALRPAFGMGFLWTCVAKQSGAEMMRVDPRTLRAEVAGKGLPAEGGAYAAGLSSVWRLDLPSGTLMRFDPKSRELSGLVRVLDGRGYAQGGLDVTSIVAGNGALWLAVA